MLKTTIDDAIRDDSDLCGRVAEADKFLKGELGESAKGLDSAAWSLRRDDKGRPVLDLTFRDVDGETAVDAFAPDELDDRNRFGARAYRLWGDLLQSRTRKDLVRLHAIVRGWEGELVSPSRARR